MKTINLKTIIIVISILPSLLQAQNKDGLKYLDELDSLRMKATIEKLASDDFLGRQSNSNGIVMSADYLIKQLNSYKIKEGNNNSYKQNIEAFHSKKANKYFSISNYDYSNSYSYENSCFHDSVISGSEIIFAGYGIYHSSYNDFDNVDITDKILILLKGEGPSNKFGVKLHNSPQVPSYEYIDKQKPKAVLMVNENFNTFNNYSSERLVFFSRNSENKYPIVEINELLANKILAPSNKSIKQLVYESEDNSSSLTFSVKNEFVFNGNASYKLADLNNIVSIIEGTDLKDEYIVLSAHYDHIGTNYRGEVYNGADDNASGVSAVLEIARVLNIAKKEGKGPRRSIIIVFFAAEEDGLKGSEYFLEKPIFPANEIKLCVNLDMLGRIGSGIDSIDINKGYIHALTGSYKANDSLNSVIDSINSYNTNLSIPLSYSSYFSRSDHYKFSQKGIPSVLFTNGEHKDLHLTTDDAEKIEYGALLKRSKLVFLTIWEFANTTYPFNNSTKVKATSE